MSGSWGRTQKLPSCFPEWLHHFAFLPAMYGSSICFPSLPCLVWRLFNFSHSKCMLLSYFGVNLHLPNNWWCWTFFHGLSACSDLWWSFSSYLYPFLNWVVFLLTSKSSLCILDTSPSSDTCKYFSLIIFSLSLFIFLMISFTGQIFIIWMKPSLSMFFFYELCL